MATSSTTWRPPDGYRQQLEDLYGLTCVPMWGTPRRLDFPTLGPKVCRIMELLGTPPMPWQRYVFDVAYELDPATGLLWYRNVGLSVMRQQGKTASVLGSMVHRIAAWPRQNIIYAAQTRIMARKRWEDEFIQQLEASKLSGKFTTRKGNGNEAIIWRKTRSLLGITSNTEKAGHGPPLDQGVIDEAFAHEDDRLEQAMSPAMLTRHNAQLWWASAGGTEKSVFLNKKRERGREIVEALWRTGEFGQTCYFEWMSPDHEDRTSSATWLGCMPAVCPTDGPCTCDPSGTWHHTTTVATIRAELENMDADEFDRAYLNRTNLDTPPPDPNVPAKEWRERVEVRSRAGKDLAFAVDITPARDSSSIGVASPRDDGRMHLELIDIRPGTDWVLGALLRLVELWDPVAVGIDAKGPAGALLLDLEKKGLTQPDDPAEPRRGEVYIPTAGEVAQACGSLADAIRQDGVVHIDQVPLNVAIGGARTRPLVDAWAWARRAAAVNISPLVTITIARRAYEVRAPLVKTVSDPSVWVF